MLKKFLYGSYVLALVTAICILALIMIMILA